jgi:hypothetical protein
MATNCTPQNLDSHGMARTSPDQPAESRGNFGLAGPEPLQLGSQDRLGQVRVVDPAPRQPLDATSDPRRGGVLRPLAATSCQLLRAQRCLAAHDEFVEDAAAGQEQLTVLGWVTLDTTSLVIQKPGTLDRAIVAIGADESLLVHFGGASLLVETACEE